MKKEKLFFNKKEISGPIVLTPEVYEDKRGFFLESYNKTNFSSIIKEEVDFKQDNHSYSSKNVLRGLHFQFGSMAQGKLVRCVRGEIYDVAVDIRVNSPTFKNWVSCKLSDRNFKQLWIPKGFAHGFLTLSESAEVVYKTTNYYSKNHEKTILWNDDEISIDWPLENSPTISDKDKNGVLLRKIKPQEIF